MQTPMSRRAVRLVALAFAAALCAIAPGAASASTTPTITWGDCPPFPDRYTSEGIDCGRMSVPLDYQQPDGRQIELQVTRLPASDPQKRRGVLFTESGGPGGENFYLPDVYRKYAPELTEQYDIVGVDPRGVAYSTPVTCGLSAHEAGRAMVPLMEPGGFDATVDFMRDVAEGCARHSGDLLPHITTANTARDFDQVRAALGEEKISYMGWSYGTYLGGVYATLFPERTDRFVLDSNVHPDWLYRKQFRSWGLAGDPSVGLDPRIAPRFDDFAHWAAERDAELGFGSTVAEVRATYFDLLEQVYDHPIDVGEYADGPMWRELTYAMLNYPGNQELADFWTLTRQLLQQPPATRPTDPPGTGMPPEDNGAAAGLAIACGEAQWPRSVDTYRRQLAVDTTLFPVFGELGSNIWPCAFWPHEPKEPLVELSSEGPRNILLVQKLRDPATPYAGGLAMRFAMGQRSTLTTVDGNGHGVFILDLGDNQCGNAAVTDYLVTGVLPPDQYCPREEPAVTTTDARRDEALDLLRDDMLPGN